MHCYIVLSDLFPELPGLSTYDLRGKELLVSGASGVRTWNVSCFHSFWNEVAFPSSVCGKEMRSFVVSIHPPLTSSNRSTLLRHTFHLSTSQKEYVVWILSAKQEKTKSERLVKLVEKLSEGKKNPSDK